MRIFILSLQFLTRIPLNIDVKAEKEDFAKCVPYFPVVGLITGSFSLLAYFAARWVSPGWFPAVMAVLAMCAVTGALHVDGMADTCDGIFSARSRERMLEIMKDSRIGTHGAIAVIFDLLLKISLLFSLQGDRVIYGLLAAPIAAKTFSAVLLTTSRDARQGSGMGSLFMEGANRSRMLAAVLIGCALTAATGRLPGLVAFAALLPVMLLYKRYIYKKIGGMTGDTLGAANEVFEILFLFFLLVLGRLM